MRYLFSFIVVLFLIGCQAPRLNSFNVRTLTDERPIALNVGRVRVDSTVMRYDRKPHIEETLPVTPNEALEEWAQHRFDANNPTSPVNVIMTIHQADMTEREEKGANWYTLDNYAYRLTYQITMEFEQEGHILYKHTVDGWESSSLPQRSSMADKEAVWLKMMNAMIRKVNQQMIDAVPIRFRGSDY